MAVRTHIDQARPRVETERDAVESKLEALGAFVDRVSELSAEPSPPSPSGVTATAGAQLRAESSPDGRCRAVRTAFDETVRPHSVAEVDGSEPLLATIRSELTDSVAVALAPTTDVSFSPDLKRMIVAEAKARRTETDVLRRALEREETQLANAGDTVDDITAWIAETDETPLTDLGFEALRRRHETLARHRDRCEKLARRRQEFLGRTTSESVEAGVRHESLVPYLYEDFPVDHPVLATVARLDVACEACQRAVRDHLVRRA
jgi:hypothetical protein